MTPDALVNPEANLAAALRGTHHVKAPAAANDTLASTPCEEDTAATTSQWPIHNQRIDGKNCQTFTAETVDHFSIRDGIEFAGTHLILDLWGASQLDDLALMEATLRSAVEVAGATLLHIHLHHFTPNGGISGVAVLAESHISVHSWPERKFAAFDVFMCGDAQPELTVDVLRNAFSPERVEITECLRGTRKSHAD